MTQYLLGVCFTDGDDFASGRGDAGGKEKAVDVFNAELQAQGAWVFAGGLHPVETATVVRVVDGDVQMTDGPFAETKEFLGGLWIIEAPDLDAALAWAAKGAAACGEVVEVRPFQELPEA